MGHEDGRISRQTAQEITDELEAANRENALWRALHIERHSDERELIVFVDIVDDDPFEPTRLDRIFDITERAIVTRIPSEIPIRDRRESWRVLVHTEGDNALIDGIGGGEKVAARTMRLSDGLGPPNR
ncbi:MAG: hypothetical protein M3N13_01845 [Candidatus Eremiobacteraeota bacterium]|nr:hypothetical protein [Candidatus Eremiobacteraeota bacterium]